jgi:hypothetical protein
MSLARKWVMLYERGGDRKGRGISIDDYKIELIEILKFDEVRTFFYVMDAIKSSRPINNHVSGSALHIMADGVSPTWESVSGYDLSISAKKTAAPLKIHEFYERLVMAAISGYFHEEICGVTVSMRYNKIMFRVWMKKKDSDREDKLYELFKVNINNDPVVNNCWWTNHCSIKPS